MFNDFQACSEYLISADYTNPSKLTIQACCMAAAATLSCSVPLTWACPVFTFRPAKHSALRKFDCRENASSYLL